MENSHRYLSLLPKYFLILSIAVLLSVLTSKGVTTLHAATSIQPQNIIVIDAGHGGVDGGAISCSGNYESHINLEIAQRLDDLLHLIGIQTIMIRDTDTSIHTEGNTIATKKISDLKQRVKIVNQNDTAILVSIHQNYYTDSRYYGAQVFYSGIEGSRQLAERIQTAVVNTLNIGSTRKIKKAQGIYLMEHISRPGILIECGFLSNPKEEAKLTSSIYQQKLCCVFASQISQYLSFDMLS